MLSSAQQTVKPASVAIVVPCHRRSLTPAEQISYQRIWAVYGHLPIFLLSPSELDVSAYTAGHPELGIVRFPFRTLRDYSQLLLQTQFYERFRGFEYILIYQLDCYILRDELLDWCGRGFDYLGAPLFHGFEPPIPEGKLWCVGNGGLSLRRVDAALAVLSSRRRHVSFRQYWAEAKSESRRSLKGLLAGLAKVTRFHNDVRWATLSNFNEDVFWALEAIRFLPSFKLPDVKTGLAFAFDYAPAYCYEQTAGRLPFACHAWPRYDLEFWKKFIPAAAGLPN